jgi:YidC/Oxa1 family membrane protein insertase
MLEQRNLVLAVLLSVAIIVGFEFLTPKPPAPTPEEIARQQQVEATTTPGTASGGVPGAGVAANGAPIPGAGPASVANALAITAARNEAVAKSPRIAFDNGRIHGSISKIGARIDDLTLVDYRETVDPTSANIVMLSPTGAANPYYADFGWTTAPGATVKVPTPSTAWQASHNSLTHNTPVTLTWDNGEGLVFQRKISLDENFMFTINDSVINNSTAAVTLFPYGLVSRLNTPTTTGFYILHEGPLGVLNDTLTEIDYEDVVDAGRIPHKSTGGWIGITDKYWLTALIPNQKSEFEASFNHAAPNKADKYQVDFLQNGRTIAAKSSTEVTNQLFAGAKEVHLLDRYEETIGVKRFDLAVDFGWFYFLTKPFFYAIDWFYKLLGNFGLAILALTVCVRIVFFPLANKSFKAMTAMKKLQPEIKKLREQYGDDRTRMNQAMMELYKKEKANPMAGCLPIALQIPVFFSLYKVLFVSIEMRHAPFYGWISDLSAQDPTTIINLFGLVPWTPPAYIPALGIWPIIMGLTMFLQQKLNPQPADPLQAKIFMFLPIMFTFMLASFPAGLVIYWSWNNALSMAQQYLIMKRAGVPIGGK